MYSYTLYCQIAFVNLYQQAGWQDSGYNSCIVGLATELFGLERILSRFRLFKRAYLRNSRHSSWIVTCLTHGSGCRLKHLLPTRHHQSCHLIFPNLESCIWVITRLRTGNLCSEMLGICTITHDTITHSNDLSSCASEVAEHTAILSYFYWSIIAIRFTVEL